MMACNVDRVKHILNAINEFSLMRQKHDDLETQQFTSREIETLLMALHETFEREFLVKNGRVDMLFNEFVELLLAIKN